MSDDFDLTSRQFDELIQKPVAVVDFWASWCMPCLIMSPIVEELANKFKGKIEFGKINVDDNQNIASKFNISSIPTLMIFKNGKPVDKITGALPAEIIEEKIQNHL